MRLNKRHFTFIETLVAISLTALLMATLSYFYAQLNEVDSKAEKSVQSLYQLAYVESRLASVLPKAVAENTSKKDFLFFTSDSNGGDIVKPNSKSLIFTYDNGIDLDKLFANHVVGRLFIDKDNRLVLATWPSPLRWKEESAPPLKKEVLLDNVEAMDLSFFIAPSVDRSKVSSLKPEVKTRQVFTPEPPGGWVSEWRSDYYELPVIVKMTLKRGPKVPKDVTIPQIEFSFPLANSPKVIFYTS